MTCFIACQESEPEHIFNEFTMWAGIGNNTILR